MRSMVGDAPACWRAILGNCEMRRSVPIFAAIACLAVFLLCRSADVHAEAEGASSISLAGRQSYERGLKQLEASQFDEAIQSFTEVIELHPDFPEAYTARAAAYQGQGPHLNTITERDRVALRAISDRNKAGELLAEKRLAEELEAHKRPLYSPIAFLVVYLAGWSILFYFWKAKRFSLVWPILGFFFCGPLALLCLGLYCLGAEAIPRKEDLPFGDHPLEVALRNQRDTIAARTGSDDMESTKACPNCGRINSASTRICPSCEQRMS